MGFYLNVGGSSSVSTTFHKVQPHRHFPTEEIIIATNCYDGNRIVVYDGGYRLYKVSLKDRPIFVKKYDSHYPLGLKYYAYKDIVIGSQMSGYKNVLKVLGCCLETQNPSVVYEFACKSLSRSLSATNVKPVLPWKCRLRIAMDLANAVTSSHSIF
ncbi:non-functional pseudokinase ZED1-like [Gossypium raimondii]|uniref:non-functional pseudokinase ZED1-like n=1 Tax=Gossypium raimondii TaxID=29730 RepID=UPI00227C404B|nr:non-functional pseudokinase ZED1-like [Gossypium raimondii]